MKQVKQFENIINGDYCIGCGACAAVSDQLKIELNSSGEYAVTPISGADFSEDVSRILSVCPFSNEGDHEDPIGSQQFSSHASPDSNIGWFSGLYAGYVNEGSYREDGTSGGIISWILSEFLKQDLVDGIIHVKAVEGKGDEPLFRYGISSTVPEVLEGSKSRYYPIEMSEVMNFVRTNPGRYAFVGLPCFVKAARRLCLEEELFKERICFFVGLVCGHLKSTFFADCFAWQSGIGSGELESIDFRVKAPGRVAYDYDVKLKSKNIETTTRARGCFGQNWGWNSFRYSACDYCDDVFAETADITVGDAWLQEYMHDDKGNSVVVVRNPQIGSIIQQGIAERRLHLDALTPETMAKSQEGGLRDRREGLAYRLHKKESEGEWAPNKRVESSNDIPPQRQEIYACRLEMREATKSAWKEAVSANDFSVFKTLLAPYVQRFDACYAKPDKKKSKWRFLKKIFRK